MKIKMKVLPTRDSEMLNQLIQEMGLQEVVIDATERQIQRPKDYEVQKEYYSGKKKLIRSRTPLSLIKRLLT
ncbi:MAG: transposase family protein [Bacteroidia bacterium]|nr:transposase family protein [Bacteroidia bacterium]